MYSAPAAHALSGPTGAARRRTRHWMTRVRRCGSGLHARPSAREGLPVAALSVAPADARPRRPRRRAISIGSRIRTVSRSGPSVPARPRLPPRRHPRWPKRAMPARIRSRAQAVASIAASPVRAHVIQSLTACRRGSVIGVKPHAVRPVRHAWVRRRVGRVTAYTTVEAHARNPARPRHKRFQGNVHLAARTRRRSAFPTRLAIPVTPRPWPIAHGLAAGDLCGVSDAGCHAGSRRSMPSRIVVTRWCAARPAPA